jgi:hypothetical protein
MLETGGLNPNYILDFKEMSEENNLDGFSTEVKEKIQRDKVSGLKIYVVIMRKLPDGEPENIAIQSYMSSPRTGNVPSLYRRIKRSEEDSLGITNSKIEVKFGSWITSNKKTVDKLTLKSANRK